MLTRVVALVAGVCLWSATAAEAQFAFPAPVVPAENFQVELGAVWWRPAPEMQFQTGERAAEPDDQVDFVGDLGIERQRVTEFRMALRPGQRHRFRFTYLPMEYAQETVLERAVTFGDTTFDAGSSVAVDADWTQWRFGYQYDLASAERGQFGILTELRFNRITSGVAAGEQTQTSEARVRAPAVGFVARGYLHRHVSLTAELGGFGLPGLLGRWLREDDVVVTIRDFDLYATANAGRHLGVQGGYRRLRAEYLVEEFDRGTLRMAGWYFGGVVRF